MCLKNLPKVPLKTTSIGVRGKRMPTKGHLFPIFHFVGLPTGFSPKFLCSSFIALYKSGNSSGPNPSGLPGTALNRSFRVFILSNSTNQHVTSFKTPGFPIWFDNILIFFFCPKFSAKKYISILDRPISGGGLISKLLGQLP